MDPREMETLVQRLVQNPHDQETITFAHQAGQSDPKSYAMLLEKVGTATSEPAVACHWLTEAANVWSTTLGDAHRAARALMIAIDRDPTQATPADRLAELYREKGDTKALVALLERRAKALAMLALHEPALRGQLAILHEELGQLWQNPPLEQPKKAIENYKRAIEFDPGSQFSIYAIRELYKGAGQWSDAVPFFALEQALVSDPERKIALFQDEGDVRKSDRRVSPRARARGRARSDPQAAAGSRVARTSAVGSNPLAARAAGRRGAVRRVGRRIRRRTRPVLLPVLAGARARARSRDPTGDVLWAAAQPHGRGRAARSGLPQGESQRRARR